MNKLILVKVDIIDMQLMYVLYVLHINVVTLNIKAY